MQDREITPELKQFFDKNRYELETSYLTFGDDEPWRQSGMSGPENRWVSLRKPVADCIEHSGRYLDIGCANGYLIECVLKWIGERGLTLEPYGLDISEKLIGLAKKRLPMYGQNFYIGNCFTWIPPLKFDYISTRIGDYVPEEHEKEWLYFLKENYLADEGNLLILMTGKNGEPEIWLRKRLQRHGITPNTFKDGYDPILNRQASVAIVNKKDI